MFSKLSKNSQQLQTSKYVFLASNILINILLGSLLTLLWRILGSLTSLTILTLIAIPLEGPAKTINSFLLGFSQLDILPSQQILNLFFSF